MAPGSASAGECVEPDREGSRRSREDGGPAISGGGNDEIQRIASADVIVIDQAHLAVALKYDKERDNAPRVTAKGLDGEAQRIQEIARKSGGSCVSNALLARALFGLDVGAEIPEALYGDVAGELNSVYAKKRQDALTRILEADVIVIDREDAAIALKYNKAQDNAPRVTARASGEEARHIQALARKRGVSCVDNGLLARALLGLDVGSEIPEDLYDDVAEILNAVYAERKQHPLGGAVATGGLTSKDEFFFDASNAPLVNTLYGLGLGNEVPGVLYADATGTWDLGGAAGAWDLANVSERRVGKGVTIPRPEYAKYIFEACALYNVPVALAYAIVATESDFNPRAVSSAGAQGLMQLMPQTAREMSVVDPFDPEQNIAGGVRYVRFLADRFGGDLVRVIAGYNAGPEAVLRAGGIPPYAETQDYVRKVLSKYVAYKNSGVGGEEPGD